MAFAIALVVRGLLQGVVAYLLAQGTSVAASRAPELVAKLRASGLGAGFANWVDKNWEQLISSGWVKQEPSLLKSKGLHSPAKRSPLAIETTNNFAPVSPKKRFFGIDATGVIEGTGKLSGEPTKIQTGLDAETERSLKRENESAVILARNSYNVEQNPSVAGMKNPDYLVNGSVADCYSPSRAKVRNVASNIDGKVASGQADTIVVNLADSKVAPAELRSQLATYPVKGLKKVIVIDQTGSVTEIYGK